MRCRSRMRQDDPTLTCFVDRGNHVTCENHVLRGESLVGNTHLHTLSLGNPILTERAALALSKGIAQSKVASLEFTRTGAKEPLKILFEGIRSLSTLETLLFNGVPAEEMNILRDSMSSMPTLRRLTITRVEGCRHGLLMSQILTRTTS